MRMALFAPRPQTVELSLQVRLFDAHRGPGSADQGGLEPRGAFAHAGVAAFSGAFVIARTNPSLAKTAVPRL